MQGWQLLQAVGAATPDVHIPPRLVRHGAENIDFSHVGATRYEPRAVCGCGWAGCAAFVVGCGWPVLRGPVLQRSDHEENSDSDTEGSAKAVVSVKAREEAAALAAQEHTCWLLERTENSHFFAGYTDQWPQATTAMLYAATDILRAVYILWRVRAKARSAFTRLSASFCHRRAFTAAAAPMSTTPRCAPRPKQARSSAARRLAMTRGIRAAHGRGNILRGTRRRCSRAMAFEGDGEDLNALNKKNKKFRKVLDANGSVPRRAALVCLRGALTSRAHRRSHGRFLRRGA